MEDNKVLEILITDKNKINSHYKQIIDKNKELEEYLLTRYTDSLSIHESIYRIWHNLEKRPVCAVCGKEVKFISGFGFRECCSVSCSKKLHKQVDIECTDDIIKQEYSQTGPRNKTQDKFLIEHYARII